MAPFADLIAVPQRNLHAVPDALSDDIAVFTEPVAAVFQIPVRSRSAARTASSSLVMAVLETCVRRCWRGCPIT